MSLIGVLRTGVSGMNAQANRLSTVAENIQNSSTTGYKRTSTEFSSLLLDTTSGGSYNSGALETTVRHAIGEQGPVAFTTSQTDLAIQGNGFFVVRDPGNATSLTRAGNFVVDGGTGNLVNAGGFTLMGYDLAKGAPNPALNSVADLVPINVATVGAKATPSTAATLSGNLPDAAKVIVPDTTTPATTLATSPPPDGKVYSKKTSLVTYDNVGNAVTLDVYLSKTAANKWSFSVFDAAAPTSFPATPLATPTTITFDGNGQPTGATSATVPVPNGKSLAIDLSGVRQLAGDYDLKGSSNGAAPSSVTGAAFGPDGTVYAVYADGSRTAAYRVPIADVASPDHLDPRAGNVFTPTEGSGELQVGFAGLGGRGLVKSGALEQSNADVSTELTAMIESQSVYTANSKVFQTGNELLEALMNLKR